MKKIIALTLALIMGMSCFSLISFAEGTSATEHLTEVPEGYVGVYTKDDLYAVRENLSGKYILMNNILFEDKDYIKGGDFYNSGAGWEPIGTESRPFQGIFDGNGYNIYNLYIYAPNEDYQGLFGQITEAEIENVNMINTDITGKDYVGGICGYAFCDVKDFSSITISNCSVNGTIAGCVYVGGICGGMDLDEEFNSFFVTKCVNSANITADSKIGGIIGSATTIIYTKGDCSSSIANCINLGNISGTSSNVGGIIGYAMGFEGGYYGYYVYVYNCINVGNVSARSFVGGIFGYSHSTGTACNRSYSIGKVTGIASVGGCFGTTPSKTSYCYYLDESVVNPTCTAGIAKSEDQLRKKGTFESWDFDTIWTMDGREDYPYPELRDVTFDIHKHSYNFIVTEPTCFENGFTTYTCKCGDSYIDDYTDKIPHVYTSKITTQPTHIKEGVETFYCYCGDSYMKAIARLEPHSHKTNVTPPTCTSKGYTTYICECGDRYISDYVGVIAHNYSATVSRPATHLSEGIRVYTCVSCGDSYNETIPNTKAHKYIASVTAPTCTTKGYTTYTCECTDSYISDYTDIIDHKYATKITTPSTHLKEGVKTFTCVCGDSYIETIEKITEHTYTSKVTIQPTHLKEGVETFTCACGDNYNKSIEKIAKHTYHSAITTYPTHLTEGVTTYTCACGDSYTTSIPKITSHSYHAVEYPPTCSSNGYTIFTCECGNSYIGDHTAKISHTYASTVIEASCTADGYTTYTCTCGDTYTETIKSEGHSFDGSKCKACGYDKAEGCNCNCHKRGISAIIWKIINLFNKLLKRNPVCTCGANHY